MVRELIHDPLFLGRKSVAATQEDLQVARDLLDTLIEHRETCVGMAANMIGALKRIIVFSGEDGFVIMFNPEILK
ncbi:MAG: peptide deformylase, partial [Oscillospiraceae bacterium]|nr:peptide deformylase [Oscillospiraceae bacterium]